MPAPDEKLIRQRAGSYRTADGRFTLENDGGSWFLLDAEHTDELGQPLLTGPFASRALARAAIERARAAKVPEPRPRPTGRPKVARRPAKPKPPAPAPETWIDRLSDQDRRRARRTIAALERLGVAGAEEAVRAELRGAQPAVARRLIEHMLDGEIGPDAEPAVQAAVRAALQILTARGVRTGQDLPRWALVEVGTGEPPGRRIVLGE
ncbi:MAG TPA: hypothetical protein VHK06_06805 [Candidatus Limnocylindria bacterium]|nr:hypothetical protein [Candidatus Limnocylindria bacterium]